MSDKIKIGDEIIAPVSGTVLAIYAGRVWINRDNGEGPFTYKLAHCKKWPEPVTVVSVSNIYPSSGIQYASRARADVMRGSDRVGVVVTYSDGRIEFEATP